MTFEEKVKKNALKYVSSEYKNSMNERDKLKLFKETAQIFSNRAQSKGVRVSYQGKEFVLRTRRTSLKNMGFVACDMNKNIFAAYRFGNVRNPFSVNKRHIDDGVGMYQSVVHEGTHSLQEDLINTMNRYDKQSLEYKYLLTIKANIVRADNEVVMFGLPLNGSAYIDYAKPSGSNDLDDLNFAFYNLMITERFAVSTSARYGEIIAEIGKPQSNAYSESIALIQDRYGCENYNESQICHLIDEAQRKIYTGQNPSDNLEARVMYDMMLALAHQHGDIDGLEYQKRSTGDSIAIALAEYGFCHREAHILDAEELTNNLDLLIFLDIERLENISSGELINNPKGLLYAVYNYGEDAVGLVPDKQILKEWCYLPTCEIDDDILRIASQYLGHDFSPEVCRTMREESTLYLIYDDEMEFNGSEQTTDEYVERYSFSDFDEIEIDELVIE